MVEAAIDFTGIVVSRQNFREHDALVRFLTSQYGFKTFIARGLKRPKAKLAGVTLPFTLGDYVGVVRAAGLSQLRTAKGTQLFRQPMENIVTNAYATYIFDLIRAAFPEGQAIPRWYDIGKAVLLGMDRGLDPAILANIVEIQLLPAFGVAPQLRVCAICGRDDRPMDYSEGAGGLICNRHWAQEPYRFHASAKAIYYLRRFSVVNINQVQSINVNVQTKAELRTIIDRIYSDTVGTYPRSKRFIDSLGQWNQDFKPLKPRNASNGEQSK
ncbi:DNA repair protein RecO [Schleiferilactobacillus perolens]|jgi:DNA repair protein RecO (recombination protein O)|uniref:DNA repair protein RecO n=1 Tax=Schleiferilactobacillus perolens TaxID=100468 RepID=UPI002355C57A|nr:DNA repair protein RecO [Schleiferilactobacillus perolens]MCI2172100.1 DNA repair protein RecO [Schleiferilactobacillus perolens]